MYTNVLKYKSNTEPNAIIAGRSASILIIFNDFQTGPLVTDEVSNFRWEMWYTLCWKVLNALSC